jgi:hypothetical protein
MDISRIAIGAAPPHDINVVIEIPKGGEPVKYELDKESGALFVDRFLHTAMFYPGNYGFIPHTLSGDGDPCDVLVVGQVPVVPGAVIRSRPIGALLMRAVENPEIARNLPRTAEALAGWDRQAAPADAAYAALATDLADPAKRLEAVSSSMRRNKEVFTQLPKLQQMALSAFNVSPLLLSALSPALGSALPPFNLAISNVPGSRESLYWNGARLDGNYPFSIALDGQALNITLSNNAENLDFGLVGCRRSVPRLQRLLGHLDESLADLELAVGMPVKKAAAKKPPVKKAVVKKAAAPRRSTAASPARGR